MKTYLYIFILFQIKYTLRKYWMFTHSCSEVLNIVILLSSGIIKRHSNDIDLCQNTLLVLYNVLTVRFVNTKIF